MVYDWNLHSPAPPAALSFQASIGKVKVVDETLRDGLQNVSGHNPKVDLKIELLHAMVSVGVDVASLGFPAAGDIHFDDVVTLCREIADARLPLIATAAARTTVSDVASVARVADKAGFPIEVYAFIGSSPIRHLVEGWDLAFLLESVRLACAEAARAGLPFCLVTEDSTRSEPAILRALIRSAVDGGAVRVCLCDTAGHATAFGVVELTAFALDELAALGAGGVLLDWHGHNDRGLGLPTALWAASRGVDRVHGTGLGIGERAGNTSLELLVHNLGLLGARPIVPIDRLRSYCERASRALGWEIPADHPIMPAIT